MRPIPFSQRFIGRTGNGSRFQVCSLANRQFFSSASVLRNFKDPMADMTEEEKEQHRKEIRELTQKTFSIAYGIIGGAMAAIGLLVAYRTVAKK